MTISRAQLAKELEPGLNALFGLEYRSEKETIMKMILARLSEPSTYAGAAAMLASLGVMGLMKDNGRCYLEQPPLFLPL